MKINKILVATLSFFLFAACNQEESPYKQRYNRGLAQGSTYNIQYVVEGDVDYQTQIDSILKFVDNSMSTYVPSSLISRINRGEQVEVDEHFMAVLKKSFEVHEATGGLFDITIYPLMKLWGFGENRKMSVDSAEVDSVLQLIGMDKIELDNYSVKLAEGTQIDFNAIAQGYTVDMVAEFLESKNIEHYLVEIGGEVRCKGKTIDEKTWLIGIEKPEAERNEDKLQTAVYLENASLATSGSYRKYIEIEGSNLKYSHALNPITGYPTHDALLSVSVVTPNCMEADAYATALLVMGLKKSQEFLAQNPKIQAYLIYHDEFKGYQIWHTPGFDEMLKN